MNKTLFIAAMLVATIATAQRSKSTTQSEENSIATQVQLFKNALKYNDASVAINSLHQIILKEGENSTYKDTLAVVYFRTNNYISNYISNSNNFIYCLSIASFF